MGMGSRPPTNYFDMPPVQSRGLLADYGAGAPSDASLERSVGETLRSVDLNTVAKWEIRRVLEERFGMDLTSRKATISAAIVKGHSMSVRSTHPFVPASMQPSTASSMM